MGKSRNVVEADAMICSRSSSRRRTFVTSALSLKNANGETPLMTIQNHNNNDAKAENNDYDDSGSGSRNPLQQFRNTINNNTGELPQNIRSLGTSMGTSLMNATRNFV